jgi:phosphatidate cytidylyltransferase
MTGDRKRVVTREILLRIISSSVLIPLGLGAVALGGPALTVLTAACAMAASAEWTRMATRRVEGRALWPIYLAMALTACAASLVAVSGLDVLLLVSFAGAAGTFALSRLQGQGGGYLALGAIYVSLPFGAFIWIREIVPDGRAILFAILGIVWATDIGAYFAGRGFGGPRLAPRESPNKTWAGAIGALVCAGLVGLCVSGITGASGPHWLATAIVLSVIAQGGDLLESRFKRMFGVKDTSGLLPGHGGVLDRLDSLIAAVATSAVLLFLAPGLAPGLSPGGGG